MEQPIDESQGGGYGSTGRSGEGSKKLQQTHAQVNEVVDIMRENVEKVIDRDIKLSELDDRANALQQGASQFETQAAKLKSKFWWKNMKMWIILIVIGLIVVIIIVASQTKQQEPQQGGQYQQPMQQQPMQQPVLLPQQPMVGGIAPVENSQVVAGGETAGLNAAPAGESEAVNGA